MGAPRSRARTTAGTTAGTAAGKAARAVAAAGRTGVRLGGDLLLGAACPGCRAPGLGLCADCRLALDARTPTWTAPDPSPPGFPRCVTTGPYDVRVRQLVIAAKEQQALSVSAVLGDLLARSIRGLLGSRREAVEIVPVPSSPAAVRRRGYDATDAMTRHAVRRLRRAGRPVRRRRLLRLARRVADQSGLGVDARAANLAGAYVARPGRGRVVVVDDVVTTGASLNEAARALRAAGWTVIGAAVVAATERRHAVADRPGHP